MFSHIGLRGKVVLTIVAVGFFPLVGGLVWVGFYGRSVLVEAAGEKFTELAKQTASHVAFVIDREVHEAQSLALSEELRRAVVSRDRNSVMAAEAYLKAYQNLKEDEYDAILLLDREGRIVATPRPPPVRDDQGGGSGWRAVLHGDGRTVYIGGPSVGKDGGSRIELAVPVTDSRSPEILGALRFAITGEEITKILEAVKIGTTGRASLVDGHGQTVMSPPGGPAAHRTFAIDRVSADGWFLDENRNQEGRTVSAFATVRVEIPHEGDPGLEPWRVVITQAPRELLAPIHRILWTVTALGGGLVGLLVVLGTVAGRRLLRPILELQRGAQVLARGELGHRLRIHTHDELEGLATTINEMAERLQQRTGELLAARDDLNNIIEQSAALIITTNSAGEIREFNRGAEQILGYGRHDVVGKSLDLIWDDQDEFRQVMIQVTGKGSRVNYETLFARRDGAPVPVSCSLTQLTDRTGAVTGLVVVGEDLTERRQLMEARLRAERLTALHRLSLVLTHDLRSPLVGILKALTLLDERHGTMTETQLKQLTSDLVRGGDLLLGTINDLLDVYRHSLSTLPLRYTEFVLGDAIHEVIRLLEADAQARGIAIETQMVAPDLVIRADRRRIQRVVFNLLDNAFKYTPPGGVVSLHVGSAADGVVRLEVNDQGPGIPEPRLPWVFECLDETPSNPPDSTDRGGVGVGLYFCRVTVEAHGGRIGAENRPEGGARFVVDLPLRDER
jgi:PAS domain S-box-containing protein